MSAVLERLERSLRQAIARRRRVLVLPAFEVFLAESGDYLLNLAVPTEREADWDEAVAGLLERFRASGRRARLEFFAELHPGLGAALEARGFALELRAPVMTLVAADLAPAPETPPGRYLRYGPDDGDALKRFLLRQHRAYGGEAKVDPLAFYESLCAGLADGSVWVMGLEVGGEVVAGASLILEREASELAGVWTHPDERRRGLAFAVCQRLLFEHFVAFRAPCWLSAAAGAEGLYRRLGFRWAGTQLNYGLGPA